MYYFEYDQFAFRNLLFSFIVLCSLSCDEHETSDEGDDQTDDAHRHRCAAVTTVRCK